MFLQWVCSFILWNNISGVKNIHKILRVLICEWTRIFFGWSITQRTIIRFLLRDARKVNVYFKRDEGFWNFVASQLLRRRKMFKNKTIGAFSSESGTIKCEVTTHVCCDRHQPNYFISLLHLWRIRQLWGITCAKFLFSLKMGKLFQVKPQPFPYTWNSSIIFCAIANEQIGCRNYRIKIINIKRNGAK